MSTYARISRGSSQCRDEGIVCRKNSQFCSARPRMWVGSSAVAPFTKLAQRMSPAIGMGGGIANRAVPIADGCEHKEVRQREAIDNGLEIERERFRGPGDIALGKPVSSRIEDYKLVATGETFEPRTPGGALDIGDLVADRKRVQERNATPGRRIGDADAVGGLRVTGL